MINSKIKMKLTLAFLLLMFGLSSPLWAQRDSAMITFENGYFVEETIQIGQPLNIDFNAVSELPGELRYELIDFKNNDIATIDEVTGQFTMTSDQVGYFSFLINAYLLDNPEITGQCWLDVVVFSEEETPCATLQGTISYDNTLEPVSDIYVFATLLYNPNILISYFYTYTDENGFYSFELPEGTYQIGIFSKDGYYIDTSLLVIEIACGDALTQNFTIEEPPSIYFVSYPPYPLILAVNEYFSYTPYVWTSRQEPIEFTLIDAPEGMVISPTDGTIEWTPTALGNYEFTIKAYYIDEPTDYAEQIINITVDNYNFNYPCAYINGTVTDQNNQNVPFATVDVFMPDIEYPYNDQPGYLYMSTVTDNEGNFIFYVPEGNYKIRFSGRGITTEYYQDASDYESANIVNLSCGDTSNLNINVYSDFTYETYTISGRVTDEQTGAGLHAMVNFFPLYLKDSLNYDPGYIFIEAYAETDQNGYYSATVLGGYEYIGYAYPLDCDYYEEYYNNTSNYLEAEPILVENDVADINFTLVKYANEFYNISGKVINKDNQPVSASVQAYLISMDTTGYYYNWAFPAQTNEEGEFDIYGVIPGDYVLFTFPNEIEYLPGYYVENEFATEEFLSATTITVNTENNANQYTIKLKDLIKIDTGKIVQVLGNIYNNSSEPISGVTVRAMTNEGNSVDWALSKTNGTYSLNNLVQGSFKIVAEKNGYEKFETTISLNENDESFNKDIILFAKAASVDDNQQIQQVAVYPNPATSILNVNLDLNSNYTNIQILNAVGNVVFENNYSSINSEKLTINVENLAQGNYYLIIKNQSGSYQGSFAIVR